MTDNLRASILMILTMAGFAVEDLFIKMASLRMPMGQILAILGTLGMVGMAVMARRHGVRLLDRNMLNRPFLIRSCGEFAGIALAYRALSLLPLSVATSIGQASPVAVTIGAALFLREPVGWRRWSAVAVGLLGVLLIVRPGSEAFQPASLLAVGAVFAFGARDLATRLCPPTLATAQLNFWGYAAAPFGALVITLAERQPWVLPEAAEWALVLSAAVIGASFYWMLTVALRLGEASVVGPLRYTRIVFVLVLAAIFLGESLDSAARWGLLLVIGSGLYTVAREARLRRAQRRARARQQAAGPGPGPGPDPAGAVAMPATMPAAVPAAGPLAGPVIGATVPLDPTPGPTPGPTAGPAPGPPADPAR